MSVFKRSIVRKDKCGNPKTGLITVPGRPIKIGLLGPPEARILDLAGPWEVFTRANEVLAEQQPKPETGLSSCACDDRLLQIDRLLRPTQYQSWRRLSFAGP